MQKEVFDFVVIGSGIAGLNAALSLAKHGKVLIVTKSTINASSTFFAQGGIAAVTKHDDSVDAHITDTLEAGYHHNNKDAVTFLAQSGKEAIEKLIDYGVMFDKQQDGDYVSSYEAAHSYPRILHATDFTGQEIQKSLVAHVLSNPTIEVWENTFAVDLIVKENICQGVTVLRHQKSRHPGVAVSHDPPAIRGKALRAGRSLSNKDSIAPFTLSEVEGLQNDNLVNIFSRAVVLATGGAGQLYQWTTNPEVATGDGIAIAKRAGAELIDLEFIQFHPTALKGYSSQLFLLSEALRGEGAYLVDKNGKRFMPDIHPLAELAPRDVVARAIFEKQSFGKLRINDVYLDMRHKKKNFLKKRFPKITAELEKRGYDLAKDLIPVTPAAHFLCGGVVTDLYGRTSITNLFAYGEVAATGVHGANRLASNSMLEGIVFSSQIEKCVEELPVLSVIANEAKQSLKNKIAASSSTPRNDNKIIKMIIKQIHKIMWEYVGITRTAKGLDQAMKKFKILQIKLEEYNIITPQILEVRNMVTVAMEITKSAKERQYSLGTHALIGV